MGRREIAGRRRLDGGALCEVPRRLPRRGRARDAIHDTRRAGQGRRGRVAARAFAAVSNSRNRLDDAPTRISLAREGAVLLTKTRRVTATIGCTEFTQQKAWDCIETHAYDQNDELSHIGLC